MRPATRVQMDYDIQQASDDAEQHNNPEEEPRTRQEFTGDCDINNILRRGGVPVYTRQPTYGDIDYTQDLASALATVRRADTLFEQLPGELRAQYKNRNKLIQALENGQISDELKAWLAERPADNNEPTRELLQWLKQNTGPQSSKSPTPTPPSPGSEPAAAGGSAGTASPKP